MATLGASGADTGTLVQMATVLGVGGAAGASISRKVALTQLPELVAAFHSFVGIAAVLTVRTITQNTRECIWIYCICVASAQVYVLLVVTILTFLSFSTPSPSVVHGHPRIT